MTTISAYDLGTNFPIGREVFIYNVPKADEEGLLATLGMHGIEPIYVKDPHYGRIVGYTADDKLIVARDRWPNLILDPKEVFLIEESSLFASDDAAPGPIWYGLVAVLLLIIGAIACLA